MKIYFFWFYFLYLAACDQKAQVYTNDMNFTISHFLKLPEEINECSGMVAANGMLILINDAGDGPYLYKLSIKEGEKYSKIKLKDAKNVDWETIIEYEDELIIGDFGNNDKNRDDINIYHLRKKDYKLNEKHKLKYVNKKKGKKYDQDIDCEAMIILENKYVLFTKNANDSNTYIYSSKIGKEKLKFSQEIEVPAPVTDAYYHKQSNSILILCHDSSSEVAKNYVLVLKPLNDGKFIKRKVLNIELEEQFEAISWLSDNDFLLASEKDHEKDGNIYKIRIEGL